MMCSLRGDLCSERMAGVEGECGMESYRTGKAAVGSLYSSFLAARSVGGGGGRPEVWTGVEEGVEALWRDCREGAIASLT